MKKHLLLSAAALVLSVAAIAGPPAKGKNAKKTAVPSEIACAVMKDHKVNVKDATEKKMYADYKGNRYYFCCGGCPDQFKKDSEKFAKADHVSLKNLPKETKSDEKKSDKAEKGA